MNFKVPSIEELASSAHIIVVLPSYNIIVQVGNNGYKHEDQMVDFTYTIITPFLREVKLKELGLD